VNLPDDQLKDSIVIQSNGRKKSTPPTGPGSLLNLRRPKEQEKQVVIDDNDNTSLIAALKMWRQQSLSPRELENLLRQSNIHMRDNRGYTALAIAARYGVRNAATLLLKHGANPNTRSYQGTSVLEYATACLYQAKNEKKDQLYANILACVVLLADNGAKAVASVFDEYTMPTSRNSNSAQSSNSKKGFKQLISQFQEKQNSASSQQPGSGRIGELNDTPIQYYEPSLSSPIAAGILSDPHITRALSFLAESKEAVFAEQLSFQSAPPPSYDISANDIVPRYQLRDIVPDVGQDITTST